MLIEQNKNGLNFGKILHAPARNLLECWNCFFFFQFEEEELTNFHFSGQYSLVEPDGSIRTVDYTADPINGFNAV